MSNQNSEILVPGPWSFDPELSLRASSRVFRATRLADKVDDPPILADLVDRFVLLVAGLDSLPVYLFRMTLNRRLCCDVASIAGRISAALQNTPAEVAPAPIVLWWSAFEKYMSDYYNAYWLQGVGRKGKVTAND
jgi:hypothetical protein